MQKEMGMKVRREREKLREIERQKDIGRKKEREGEKGVKVGGEK